MYRYIVLVAAVLMQMCLGATYSWSAFVERIRQISDISQGTAQIPFMLFYIVFPATTILGGFLLSRLTPRMCAIVGGIIFGGGWFLAGFGDRSFAFTVVGIGVLGGIGVGLAYIVPIAIGVLWFPRHKGLVTGISVGGFAVGAAVVSGVADHLVHWTPFAVFRLCGLAFWVILPLAGLVMKRPPGHDQAARQKTPARAIWADPTYLVLYFAMFAGLMAGLTIIANVKQLAPAAAVSGGLSVVACVAFGNAAGRIIHGWLFDRMESRTIIVTNLLVQSVLLLASSFFFSSGSPAVLKAFAALAGFNYGGILVLYASSTARQWGADRVGAYYGWLFSSNIPASFAPMLAGKAYDRLHSFAVPMAVIAAFMITAALLVACNRSLKARRDEA